MHERLLAELKAFERDLALLVSRFVKLHDALQADAAREGKSMPTVTPPVQLPNPSSYVPGYQ